VGERRASGPGRAAPRALFSQMVCGAASSARPLTGPPRYRRGRGHSHRPTPTESILASYSTTRSHHDIIASRRNALAPDTWLPLHRAPVKLSVAARRLLSHLHVQRRVVLRSKTHSFQSYTCKVVSTLSSLLTAG